MKNKLGFYSLVFLFFVFLLKKFLGIQFFKKVVEKQQFVESSEDSSDEFDLSFEEEKKFLIKVVVFKVIIKLFLVKKVVESFLDSLDFDSFEDDEVFFKLVGIIKNFLNKLVVIIKLFVVKLVVVFK